MKRLLFIGVKRLLLTFLVVVTLLFYSMLNANAHSTSQDGILESYVHPVYGYECIGSEDIGWSVDEKYHSNTVTIYYFFDNVSNINMQNIRAGVQKWIPWVTFQESSAGTGRFADYDFERSDINASFKNYAEGTNADTGHISTWEIHLNTNIDVNMNAVIVAHELGHVIGLNDLYSNHNQNKLMYYSDASTATAPTELDLWGAKVILGIHNTHSFDEYRYWGKDTNGNHYHVQYCSDCNGNRATRARCAFSLSDPMKGCITCGYSTYLAP